MDVSSIFTCWNCLTSCKLSSRLCSTISCSKVHWKVLVFILEEAPDSRANVWIAEHSISITASSKQWTSWLSIWKLRRLVFPLLRIDTWNPDLQESMLVAAALDHLATEESGAVVSLILTICPSCHSNFLSELLSSQVCS